MAGRHKDCVDGNAFLYKEVLARDPGWLDDVVRAKRPHRLPAVLTRPEVEALLATLDGVSWIVGMPLYGSGLRLRECLHLRVQNEIVVREGKGNEDRLTMLPAAVAEPLLAHPDAVRRLHERWLSMPSVKRTPCGSSARDGRRSEKVSSIGCT